MFLYSFKKKCLMVVKNKKKALPIKTVFNKKLIFKFSIIRNDINKERLLVKTVLKGVPRDLFIFDSDGFHKGGSISSGKRWLLIALLVIKLRLLASKKL